MEGSTNPFDDDFVDVDLEGTSAPPSVVVHPPEAAARPAPATQPPNGAQAVTVASRADEDEEEMPQLQPTKEVNVSVEGQDGDGVQPHKLDDVAVARYLLDRDLVLTALEFYQETLEQALAREGASVGGSDDVGQRHDQQLAFLRERFEQQTAHWAATHHEDALEHKSSSSDSGSVPFGRTSNELSRVLKEKEDRIVLLEYELRLSKDDIQSLKNELKQLRATQARSETQNAETQKHGDEASKDTVNKSPLTEQEKRHINQLIKRYLVERGYKLTAITFGEEAEEEFASEEDASTRPQSLTLLHRCYYDNPAVKQLNAVQAELKESKEQNLKYQERMDELERQIQRLTEEKEHVEKELDYVRVRLGDKRRETSGSITPILQRSEEITLTRNRSTTENAPVSPRKAQPESASSNEHANSTITNAVPESSPRDESTAVDSDEQKADESKQGQGEAHSDIKGDTNESHAVIQEKAEDQEKTSKDSMRRRRSERLLHNLRRASIADATRIQKEVERIVTVERDNQGAVKIVAECLPHIVPGVLLNTREELIPVILVAIRQHPDTKTRDHLTQMLFNLIKIPDEHQRRIIMDGCVALSRIIGQDRTGSELLPQCWEQISSKHKERRVLVAESCGALAPFVSPELRPSLILSILIQLLDDKSPLVRAAVARNLGILISYFEESESNKYQQIQELLLRLLKDSDLSVVRMAQDLLLPMLVDWADTLDYLTTRLMVTLLAQIQNLSEISEVTEQRLAHLDVFLSSVSHIIPRFVESVLLSSPFGEVLPSEDQLSDTEGRENTTAKRDRSMSVTDALCILSPNQRRYFIRKFSEYLQEHCSEGVEQGTMWSSLEWLTFVCIPKLIDLLVPMIGVSRQQKAHEVLNIMTKGMTNVVMQLCRETGEAFVKYVLQPQFLKELSQSESEDRRLAALQVYIVGVLPHLGKETLTAYLRELTLNISLEENGWVSSHISIVNDCLERLSKRSEEMSELVLTLLWDLVVHPSTQVRQTLVKMFDHMSSFMEKEKVIKRVLPALLTLGNDIESSVRIAAVMPIGYIAINIPDNVVLERINVQFETWEQDTDELITTFASIIPHVKALFRDAFLLPKLVRLAKENNARTNNIQRQEVAKALLEAFRAFNGTAISAEMIQNGLLPGLLALQNDCEVMDSSFKKIVNSMVHDMQAATAPSTPKKDGQRKDAATPTSATSSAPASSGTEDGAPATPTAGGAEGNAGVAAIAENSLAAGEAAVGKLIDRWKRASTFNIGLKAWGNKDANKDNKEGN